MNKLAWVNFLQLLTTIYKSSFSLSLSTSSTSKDPESAQSQKFLIMKLHSILQYWTGPVFKIAFCSIFPYLQAQTNTILTRVS